MTDSLDRLGSRLGFIFNCAILIILVRIWEFRTYLWLNLFFSDLVVFFISELLSAVLSNLKDKKGDCQDKHLNAGNVKLVAPSYIY